MLCVNMVVNARNAYPDYYNRHIVQSLESYLAAMWFVGMNQNDMRARIIRPQPIRFGMNKKIFSFAILEALQYLCILGTNKFRMKQCNILELTGLLSQKYVNKHFVITTLPLDVMQNNTIIRTLQHNVQMSFKM